MKYIYLATIIFGFTLLGELLHILLPLPVPAAIYGLVLLFLALQTGIVKLHQVDAVSKFLIAIMGLLFVAPAVNIVEIWRLPRCCCPLGWCWRYPQFWSSPSPAW